MGEWRSLERRHEVLRFLIVGASNTGGTLVLFWLLTFAMPATYAYTCAFALGLLYSTAMSSRVVFRVEPTPKRHLRFVAWYLLVYLVGLGVVSLLGWAEAPRLVLVVGAAAATVPLSYFGGRAALSVGSSSTPNGEVVRGIAQDSALRSDPGK
jgi:putative flippase GtrA